MVIIILKVAPPHLQCLQYHVPCIYRLELLPQKQKFAYALCIHCAGQGLTVGIIGTIIFFSCLFESHTAVLLDTLVQWYIRSCLLLCLLKHFIYLSRHPTTNKTAENGSEQSLFLSFSQSLQQITSPRCFPPSNIKINLQNIIFQIKR